MCKRTADIIKRCELGVDNRMILFKIVFWISVFSAILQQKSVKKNPNVIINGVICGHWLTLSESVWHPPPTQRPENDS